jgi:hypothetical protein
MSQVVCYLRLGKGKNGYKVAVSLKPNAAALGETIAGNENAIPTVRLKLKLDLSPTAFHEAEVLIPIDDEQIQALDTSGEADIPF